MIYFIQQGLNGPIKIGTTGDVSMRLKNLQCANPCSLRLVGVVDGEVGEEEAIHARFKHRRIRGEWFKGSADLCKYIDELPLHPGTAPVRKTMDRKSEGYVELLEENRSLRILNEDLTNQVSASQDEDLQRYKECEEICELQDEIKTLNRKLRNWTPALDDRVERRLRAVQ